MSSRFMATDTTQPEASPSTEVQAWSETYSHLQKGYENGQQVVRAMDAKTSILTGLSVFSLGAIGGLIKILSDYFTKYPEDLRSLANPHSLALLFFLVFSVSAIAATVLGIRCIVACLGTLAARPRAKMPDAPQATILFPFLHPEREAEERQKDIAYYRNIIDGKVTRDMIQREYYDQILNLGHILWQKIAHNGQAVRLFKWQVVLTGVALVMMIPTLLPVCYVRKSTTPQPSISAAGSAAVVSPPAGTATSVTGRSWTQSPPSTSTNVAIPLPPRAVAKP